MILLLSTILSSVDAIAQEAKLVKKAEWGSGTYEHMVEINDHYYIVTRSGQVDVINPELAGESSLIGQIDFDFEPDIRAISKFDNFLIIVTNDKVNIYSITDAINITQVYSLTVSGHWNAEVINHQGDLYYVDGDNKIYVIAEAEGVFSLSKVIQSPASNYNEEVYVSDRNLFIEDSTLYYVYRVQENGTLATKVESYQLTDLTLSDSGLLEGIGISTNGVYVGDGRFVISNYQYLYLIKLIDGQVTILNDFDTVQYNKIFHLTSKNNTLKALSDNVLYTFQISESNTISTLSTESLTDHFLSNSYMRDVYWRDDKLIGLNTKSGVFEIDLVDNVIDSIAFSYNQSGDMGKAVIENNLVYLPRDSRIDIINITDIDNITLQNSIVENVKDIERVSTNLIFSNGQRISNQTIVSDSEIQLNSEVSVNNKAGPLLFKDSHIYNINFDTESSVTRHSASSLYSLYETPLEASISNPDNSCPQKLGLLADTLIASDPCSNNKIHLFTDYNTDDFAYSRTIELGFSYYQLVIANEYIYLISPEGIKIVALSESDEFVEINSIDIEFSVFNGISADFLEGYLLISDGFYFHLFETSEPSLPTLISKAKINDFEWREANFQIADNYLLVTTKDQGKIKFFQINKAPTVNEASLNINEDEISEPLITFADPEADPLDLSIVNDAINGELTVDGETIIYTPNENFNGEDTILLKAEDIHGNFIEHELLVTVNSINDVPTILTSVLTTNEDMVLTSEIAFQDIENDGVEFHLISEASNGVASISLQGVLTYSPDENFFGEDSLFVSVTDENDGISEKEIAITVTSVNDNPEFGNMSFSVDEDHLLSDQVMAADIDSEILTFSVVSTPESGTLNLQESGHFTYQPNVDYDQQDSFEIAVIDEQGGRSQAQIIISVNSVNDAPVFKLNNFSILEDTSLTQEIIFYDVDSGVHTVEILSPANNGTIEFNNGTVFTYKPDDNFSGVDNFRVSLTDEHGASVGGEIKITITPVNDAPSFTTTSYAVNEDNLLTSELEAFDIEGQALTFELINDEDLQGNVSVESDGQFSFEPALNFYGETSFAVKVTDSEASSSTQIISVSVNAVDDVPAPENASLSLQFNGNISQSLPTTDVDGQSLSYRLVTDVKNGTLTLSSAGQYNYSSNAGYAGIDSFTYEVSDVNDNIAQASVSFTVQSAAEPTKTKSSSGGSFGYLMLLSLVISFCFRLKFVRESSALK